MQYNQRMGKHKGIFTGLLTAIILLLGAGITGVSLADTKITKDNLKTQEDRISYGIGMDIGINLKAQDIPIDVNFFLQGLKDGLKDESSALMTQDEFRQEIMVYQQQRMEKIGNENKAKGEAFLAENKKKEGVVELPSGLQYKILTKGEGETPKPTDTVSCHYAGVTVDGKEFDSSYKRNEPAKFGVNQVIRGWQEALQLMSVGDKWKLFIPSSLAYGERGAGQHIGPNETLIFDIELLGIEKAQ